MEVPVQNRTTAGIRQFENTAIAKLEAEGVPSHLARAFVHQGIPKSGSQDILRNTVCKMTYEKFFVERSAKDFADPYRVGALVPTVTETNTQKFFTEFAMTDLDAARFIKIFPEFDVIARGRSFNQHAFYANKRYAETELLISMVHKHSQVNSLNARSLIDLGGSYPWHVKRGRAHVHCDNPVLSSRDVMRYVTRDVFSSPSSSNVCKHKFQDCSERADYAIGVHSTYDLTPKRIAYSMRAKGVKAFFGTINYIPGLESKPSGTYEADGIVAIVVRPPREAPYVDFTFKHDSSLHYSHRLSVLRKYTFVRRTYQFANEAGGFDSYTYSIESVRGNSIIFSIVTGVSSYPLSDAIWTPPATSLYYISLQFIGLDKMEVASEFFDRLVLEAASSRNVQEYDILALYRYAKSLRQRVSINGVVLSSGYTQNPEQLVYSTIAAFSIAAAYKAESVEYFKAATSQIVSLRGRGYLRDTFTLVGKALLKALLVLPASLSYYSGLDTLNERLKQLVAAGGAVSVELYKPHASQGMKFDKRCTVFKSTAPSALRTSQLVRVGQPDQVTEPVATKLSGPIMPSAPPGYAYKSVSSTLRPVFAECASKMYCFRSRGTLVYDPPELPRPITQFIHYDLSTVDVSGSTDLEHTRALYYEEVTRRVAGFARSNPVYQVMPNGDRLYTLDSDATVGSFTTGSDYVPFNLDDRKYMVLRGIGKSAVVLTPPTLYTKGTCVRFVLLYDHCLEYGEIVEHAKARGVDEVYHELPDTPAHKPSPVPEGLGLWTDVHSTEQVSTFATAEEESEYLYNQALAGNPMMSGALPFGSQTPPRTRTPSVVAESRPATPTGPETVTLVGLPLDIDPLAEADSVDPLIEARRALRLDPPESNPVAGSSDAAGSEEVVPGANALEELVYVCQRSEEIALETATTVVDLVISASKGQVPMSKLGAVTSSHPGELRGVVVEDGSSEWRDAFTGDPVEHMAVSDGVTVYDRITKPPPAGVYVTGKVMEVYTGAAIKQVLQSVLNDTYTCAVTCVNGVAGSGKSYHIEHHAKPGDVVLCETSRSLEDIAAGLCAIPGWRGHNYTVDAYLMHLPVRQCDVLWIDEAFRLHAAKIFAVMKLLRPSHVFAFGDDKQIPTLPFVPGYEFVYHEFPFLSIDRRSVSYRMPADVSMALSAPEYYGFHVTTHNPVLHSVHGPEQYVEGMFDTKPLDVPLLVYTRNNKEDLVKRGVRNVMTIGESQGKTFDDVIVFREDKLGKELYYSLFYTLVGASRHKRSLRYVTVDTVMNDNSLMAKLLRHIQSVNSDIVLASHLVSGVRPAYDSRALAAREVSQALSAPGRVGHSRSASFVTVGDPGVQDDFGDLTDYVADFDGL